MNAFVSPKPRLGFLVVAVATLSFVAGHAFTKEEPAGDPMAEMMKLHAPGDAQKPLYAFDGNWSCDISMWMAPGVPPEKMTGRSENDIIMDGRIMSQNFSGEWQGMSFRGLGMFAHDNFRKKYQMTWSSNMGSGILVLEGEARDECKTLVFVGKEEQPYGTFDTRWTYRLEAADRIVATNDKAKPGTNQWFKSMEIVYTRIDAAPADADEADDAGDDDDMDDEG